MQGTVTQKEKSVKTENKVQNLVAFFPLRRAYIHKQGCLVYGHCELIFEVSTSLSLPSSRFWLGKQQGALSAHEEDCGRV